jgi:hypothetical protein
MDHNRTIGIMNVQMVTMRVIGAVVSADVHPDVYAAVTGMMPGSAVRLVGTMPFDVMMATAVATRWMILSFWFVPKRTLSMGATMLDRMALHVRLRSPLRVG